MEGKCGSGEQKKWEIVRAFFLTQFKSQLGIIVKY